MTSAAAIATLPSARYDEGIAHGQWLADPAQNAALKAFDQLATTLAAPPPASLWQRLRRQPTTAPRGIYLWGDVGRGKTFLMDLFHHGLPAGVAQRVHFHRFMQAIHADLRSLAGQRDPLKMVAARIAGMSRVLCLDEFFVLDIGDAMILGNLLKSLFDEGVTLVTTSNSAPEALYRDGLQRERFLPAIALLREHCEVVELVSVTDWRLRALRQAPVYHCPPDRAAEQAMLATFRRVAGGEERIDLVMTINDREVPVRREASGVIWFDFTAICEGPRGTADYIFLARSYHTVLISGIPQFTPQTDNAARRFVELVDEVYDRGVKLVLSAATPIVDLYDGVRLRDVFARTESRLIEMQSEGYLSRPHGG